MWESWAENTSLRRLLIFALILIATTTVTVIQPIQCNSVQPAAASPPASDSIQVAAKSDSQPTSEQQQQAKATAPKVSVSAKSSDSAPVASAAPSDKQQADADQQRKGRASEDSTAGKAPESEPVITNDEKSKESSEKKQTASSTGKPSETNNDTKKTNNKSQQQLKQQQQSAAKSSSSNKSKLPANLGTVTSTGNGGPSHYMSKHDAYSAIAEKHGAVSQDSVRYTHTNKFSPDKRMHLQRFGGIQKASGMGDMLNPFKTVTDGGLARTLGASMRSIMKSKYSLPAYVASAVLSAVALLAFYESPISPLPVPALPEPPVGRFPPELANLSPNVQIPFRMNQQQYGQQAYANQRSYPGAQMPQQPQQVLFPNGANVPAQQRQSNQASPVQQLAANLLSSVGKQQSAQRKSGPDYDQFSSRSLFGSSSGHSNQKLGAPANQSQQKGGFLSYFGLGSGAPVASHSSSSRTGDLLQQAASASEKSSGSVEPKGQGATYGPLSNSHIVNKVKSYFTRAPSPSSSSSHTLGTAANNNPYDQYQKMSFMQAVAKDTAFLPAFLNPTRKSSTVSSPASSSSSANKLQQAISTVLSAGSGSSPALASSSPNAQPIAAASRMQVDNQQQQLSPANPQSNKRTSSGFGLMRAADRIAHALLDAFSGGSVLQRHAPAPPAGSQQQLDSAQKSLVQQQQSAEDSPLMSTASLISDLMLSSYAGGQQPSVSQQFVNSIAQAAGLPSDANQPSGEQQQVVAPESPSNDESKKADAEQVAARSSDKQHNSPAMSTVGQYSSSSSQSASKVASSTSTSAQASQSASSSQLHQDQQQHVRKTRSIGFEYPTSDHTLLANAQQGPSKAAQINSFVDLVSDGYKQNKMLFNFLMNRAGLSQALPYVEQILGDHQVGMANNLIQ